MLIKKGFCLAVSFILFTRVFSQTLIEGTVVNVDGHSLPYVSIILSAANKFIAGTTTDEQGKFQLKFSSTANTIYKARISLIGYQTVAKDFQLSDTAFFKSIVLTADKKNLSNITVTSKKPLIIRKADRYVINVENSFLANGFSGLDVLQKAPGIWVDNNGGIRIKGNQPVMVMINDVVQRMSEDELADYLRSLKSEDISKIEVIQNPPSEYEAAGAGGIVHIILKKSRRNGLNGTVNGQYKQQGQKSFVSTGASLDYKVNNYYFTAAYSFTKDLKSYYEHSDIIYPDKSSYKNYTVRNDRSTKNQYRFGITYDIARNQSAGILTTINTNDMTQLYAATFSNKSSLQNNTGLANTNRARTFSYSSTTFNYNWRIDSVGSSLKFIADYSTNDKREQTWFDGSSTDTSKNYYYRIGSPNHFNVYTFQSDYTKQLNSKMQLKAGAKYATFTRDNLFFKEDSLNHAWIVNATSNQFKYTENLLMFYTSVETTVGKTSIKTGLRAEETFVKGNVITTGQTFNKKYGGLFPSVFITQMLNEDKGNALYINYSRRLQRPGLRDLNPYRIEYNNYTAMTGNPGLLPQYSHSVELGYQFQKDYSLSTYIIKTTDIISLIATAGNNNFIEYSSLNLNKSFEYGASLIAPFKISKSWNMNNSFNYSDLSYRIDLQDVNTKVFSARSIHTINIKKIADVDIAADYSSSRTYANYTMPSSFSMDIGIAKKIFGRSRLRLYCTDIFNGVREHEVTDISGTHIDFYRKFSTRTFSLSFVYNFIAGRKFSSKKIDQGSGEEKSRAN